MFETDAPEVLSCGCSLTLRRGEMVELLFLEPCSEDHQKTAVRIRGVRSMIVVKGVDRDEAGNRR